MRKTLTFFAMALVAAATLAQSPADETPARDAAGERAIYLPGEPRDLFRRGVELADSGATEEAKTIFRALILTYPELPEPYINLAALLAAEGETTKAAEAAEAAIRAHPLCRAAFDIEFQRDIGSYGAEVLTSNTPLTEVPPSGSRQAGVPQPPPDEPLQSGRLQIGSRETGEVYIGSRQTGSRQTGSRQTGSRQILTSVAAAAGHFVVRDTADPCLNFRRRPDPGSTALDCLPPETRIRLLEAAGEWSRVALADGREGWMATPFLEGTSEAGAKRVIAEAADPCLNFRAEPVLEAPPLECLLPGTPVQLLETTGDWSRVALRDGREGWMARIFLVNPTDS